MKNFSTLMKKVKKMIIPKSAPTKDSPNLTPDQQQNTKISKKLENTRPKRITRSMKLQISDELQTLQTQKMSMKRKQ